MEESEHVITQACGRAVDRLAAALPATEVACLVLSGDTLRHVAHRGALRLIFEIPRELGGVVWRTVRTGEPQIVPDVGLDPDYVASDESVTSEICAPVVVDGAIVAVLDVESTTPFPDGSSAMVMREAETLAHELSTL